YVTWSAPETFCMRWPLTTSRTAWARRKTRASLVCFKNVSKVGRASSGKCSLRVRIRVVSRIKYYKNISTPRHPTWLPYYRSTAFPTQIFRKLLIGFHHAVTFLRRYTNIDSVQSGQHSTVSSSDRTNARIGPSCEMTNTVLPSHAAAKSIAEL